MKNRAKRMIIFLVGLWGITSLYAIQYSGDTTKNKTLYMSQLKTCKQEKFEKTYEYPFLVILTEENKKEYMKLEDLEQKKEYIEYYWKEHNPNPLLEENDCLHDFIKRYYHIKKHFSSPEQPYFDDRGKYYLKYGEPSYRYQEKSQIQNAELFRSPQIRSFLREIIGKTNARRMIIPMRYSIHANETWVYQFISGGEDKELVLHFVAEGRFFREVQTLDNAIINPSVSELKYFYWADMIKKRAAATQSRLIFEAFEKILAFDQDIRTAAYTWTPKTGYLDVTNPDHQLRQMKNTLSINFKRKKALTPATLSGPKKAIQELSFLYDIVQFKGPQDRTTLTINYFTPLSPNFSEGLKLSDPDAVPDTVFI
ncbi:MAG: GWxTD domain-containing protein, partial [bacterium]